MNLCYLLFCMLCMILCVPPFTWAHIHFFDNFNSPDWESRWVQSNGKAGQSNMAKFVRALPKHRGTDDDDDYAIRTGIDYSFYGITTRLDEELILNDASQRKDLVLSYSFKNEGDVQCGGGFMKVFPSHVQQDWTHFDSEYVLLFGPDVCGTQTRDVRFKVNIPALRVDQQIHKMGEIGLKKRIPFIDDHLFHTYTLLLRSDSYFSIYIDGSLAHFDDMTEANGHLYDHIDPKSMDSIWNTKTVDELLLEQRSISLENARTFGFEFWQVHSSSFIDDVYIGDSVSEALEIFNKKNMKNLGKEKKRLEEFEHTKKLEEIEIKRNIEERRKKQDEEYLLQKNIHEEQEKRKREAVEREIELIGLHTEL